jgi:hypothetical protein
MVEPEQTVCKLCIRAGFGGPIELCTFVLHGVSAGREDELNLTQNLTRGCADLAAPSPPKKCSDSNVAFC